MPLEGNDYFDHPANDSALLKELGFGLDVEGDMDGHTWEQRMLCPRGWHAYVPRAVSDVPFEEQEEALADVETNSSINPYATRSPWDVAPEWLADIYSELQKQMGLTKLPVQEADTKLKPVVCIGSSADVHWGADLLFKYSYGDTEGAANRRGFDIVTADLSLDPEKWSKGWKADVLINKIGVFLHRDLRLPELQQLVEELQGEHGSDQVQQDPQRNGIIIKNKVLRRRAVAELMKAVLDFKRHHRAPLFRTANERNSAQSLAVRTSLHSQRLARRMKRLTGI